METIVNTPAAVSDERLVEVAPPEGFLAQLAPVSVGAIFFGSFLPSHRDTSAMARLLVNTSDLYQRFLQPHGLAIEPGGESFVFTGEIATPEISRIAAYLVRQISPDASILDNTIVVTEPARIADAELQARCEFLLEYDAFLGGGRVSVSVDKGHLVATGEAETQEAVDWARRLLGEAQGVKSMDCDVRVTGEKLIGQRSLDEDSACAVVLARISTQAVLRTSSFRARTHRRRTVLHGSVRSEEIRNWAELVANRTAGLYDFQSHLTIG